MSNRRLPRLLRWGAALALGLVLAASFGCSSTLPRRDPTGEMFPSVAGESLEEEPMELPEAFAGQPTVVLIGYEQETQFDIDRWVMGLLQAEIQAPLYELPTIPGLLPTIASRWIDDGMRSGIPREDWAIVITLYGRDASPVAEWTGTEGGRKTRVVVLDAAGRAVWFDDDGYSARKALDVAELLRSLDGEGHDDLTDGVTQD